MDNQRLEIRRLDNRRLDNRRLDNQRLDNRRLIQHKHPLYKRLYSLGNRKLQRKGLLLIFRKLLLLAPQPPTLTPC